MKNKIKKVLSENKNILGLLCLFLIIQPFLDISEFFKNPKLEFFGFTIPTLIRCLFISILALMLLKKLKKSEYKYLIIYFVLVMIYTVFHHYVVSDSNIKMPDNYIYSLTSELFYIVRMILPLSIIYFTKQSKITYNKFIKTILISSAIIGTIIFIGNTFCISAISYGEGTTKINWIQWFFVDFSKYEFHELTSKGWFYMANQVSGLMMLMLPICIYDLIKKCTKLNFYASIILIISMIMLGTRVASYGWLIILACYVLVLLFLRFIRNENWWTIKRCFPILIVFLIGIIFLSVSPIKNREYGYSLGDLESLEKKPVINAENYEEMLKYIVDSYEVFGVQKTYVYDLYNYKYDPVFWMNIFDISLENGVIENRQMQRLISSRIAELNDNKLKYQLFGYSFSRMRNGQVYMEHDIIVQIFTMGYLGFVLLLGPYIFVMLLIIIKIFKKLGKSPKLVDIAFVLSMCAVLGTAIFTGHILDELFVTIYLGFICGFFLKRTHTGEVIINEKS